MNLPLSPGAAKALALLQAAGYEAWIVGGCVRDALLGLPPKDYDLTTSALPEETQRVFAAYPRIETGLRHGTATVLLEGELEIPPPGGRGLPDARHPDGVTFTRSLRQDAARRDFTINVMAYAPGQGLQDFFGGQADLAQGTIRAVGRAETRFHEDALRILRALRFASLLDSHPGGGDPPGRPGLRPAAGGHLAGAGVQRTGQTPLRQSRRAGAADLSPGAGGGGAGDPPHGGV